MRSLFIDTSSFFMNLAIIENNKMLFSFSKEVKNDMASSIVSEIDIAFQKVPFTIKDLDKIFVVCGPGSFTGIRVGVTAAKIIAWSINIPVVPLSSLELMATTSVVEEYSIPMIDARRGNVYAGVYDKQLNNIVADGLYNCEDFIHNLKYSYKIVSYDDIKNSIKPELNILKIVSKHIEDNGVLANELKPNYLKLTEAEEKRSNDKNNN